MNPIFMGREDALIADYQQIVTSDVPEEKLSDQRRKSTQDIMETLVEYAQDCRQYRRLETAQNLLQIVEIGKETQDPNHETLRRTALEAIDALQITHMQHKHFSKCLDRVFSGYLEDQSVHPEIREKALVIISRTNPASIWKFLEDFAQVDGHWEVADQTIGKIAAEKNVNFTNMGQYLSVRTLGLSHRLKAALKHVADREECPEFIRQACHDAYQDVEKGQAKGLAQKKHWKTMQY